MVQGKNDFLNFKMYDNELKIKAAKHYVQRKPSGQGSWVGLQHGGARPSKEKGHIIYDRFWVRQLPKIATKVTH